MKTNPYRLAIILPAVTLATVLASNAQAIQDPLNLTFDTPDIGSAFVSVTYTVNAGLGTLTARGQAQQLTPSAQGGSPNIQNADFFTSFDLNATIDTNNSTAAGTLVISGETPNDGFTSGTLLTGTLAEFGAGPGDPLEFIFDVTGGDAAGLFGPEAGTVLSFSGYGGDLSQNFSTSFTSVADTFSIPQPTPFQDPLNLTPVTPDIGSAFVSVTYTVNAGIGTLTARGQAQQLTPSAQGGSPNIQNADFFTSFDLNATIDLNNNTAAGTLVVSGETPNDGFTSGTLLTGTLAEFGAGPNDPLEFIFDVTGGDAAGLFGSKVGTILSFSGFGGDLSQDFSTSFTSVADVFFIPEPASLALLGLGGLAIGGRHRRTG